MRLKNCLLIALLLPLLAAGSTFALELQESEVNGLANWSAPPYWSAPQAKSATTAGRTALVSGSTPMALVAVNPCRLVDTRGLPAALPGGGFLPSATLRNYTLAGACGIPASAKAVSLNATVTNSTGPGFLVLWDKGGAVPGVSTLNFLSGQTVADAAVVPLSSDGSISVALGVSGADVILDTNGYFAPLVAVTSLNTQTGDLTLTAGSNVTITPGAGSLTIATSVAAGPTGPSGPSGPAGAAGATGPSGPAGAAGASGPSGPAGVAGATGPSGPAGAAGATGPSGPAGVAGATGPSGPAGVAGATGATGATGPSGPSGADGANGKTVLNGIVDPTTEGVDGDFYINTASNTIFGAKGAVTPGVWPASGTSLVGPSGPTGPSGPSGPQGDPGVTGATGPSGPSGPQGNVGLTGPTGPSGPSGPAGATGPATNACVAGDYALSGGTNGANLNTGGGSNYASLISQTNPSASQNANTASSYCGGYLHDFAVTLSGAPGAGNSYTFTVRFNAATNTIACTISDASTTCSNAGLFGTPIGTVNVQSNPTGGPTARSATWTATFTIPTGNPIQ